MNKRKRWLELLFIITFMALLCAIIWTSNPYSPSHQSVVKSPDTSDTIVTKPKPLTAEQEKWAEGKDLFKSSCASCHNPTVAQTGPALMGVTKRWTDAGSYQGKTGAEWLHKWIRNWNEPIAAGYPYAVSIKQHYNESPMNTFPNLTDEKIDKILLYVESPDRGVSPRPVAIQ